MQKLLALVLMATSLTAAPTFALAQAGGELCGPDGPEGYKRPGGYCEKANNSIYNLHNGSEGCIPLLSISKAAMLQGVRADVAVYCTVYEATPT